MEQLHFIILAIATVVQLCVFSSHPGGVYCPSTELLEGGDVVSVIPEKLGHLLKLKEKLIKRVIRRAEEVREELDSDKTPKPTRHNEYTKQRTLLRHYALDALSNFDPTASKHGEENTNYMTNTADKLLYELKNFAPLPSPRATPQFNPPVHTKGGPNMVIGISTVYRQKENYLFNTVANILHRLSKAERRTVRIIVMNGDVPASKNKEVQKVREEFEDEIEAGLLTIKSVCDEHGGDCAGHPELAVEDEELLHRWGDNPQRVRWRAKQVLDVASLMQAAAGEDYGYFLMLEDDVKVAKSFPTAIRQWVDSKLLRRTDWLIASFYNPWKVKDLEVVPPQKFFGVIGQLFRVHDLPHIVSFLRRNFDESPLDWLFVDYLTKHKVNMIAHAPSLFQHLGKVSSLAGKTQPSRAAEFEEYPLEN